MSLFLKVDYILDNKAHTHTHIIGNFRELLKFL